MRRPRRSVVERGIPGADAARDALVRSRERGAGTGDRRLEARVQYQELRVAVEEDVVAAFLMAALARSPEPSLAAEGARVGPRGHLSGEIILDHRRLSGPGDLRQ